MSFSYDPNRVTGALSLTRLLLADTNQDAYDFEDEELQGLLGLPTVGQNPLLAAAMAYRTLAGNRARLAVRVVRAGVTEDLSIIAKELRATADSFIADADSVVLELSTQPSWERYSWEQNRFLRRQDEIRGGQPIISEGMGGGSDNDNSGGGNP